MTEPTTEQWRDLHRSFREFCQLAPWRWLDDTDVLAVEHPSGEYTGYCTVLGSAGREYGLAVFVGDEGLSGYMALMTEEVVPDSMHAFVSMNALSAILADREDMDGKDRAIVRGLGLKYRGRGSWPHFRSATPGFVPWYLDADQAAFLTTAVRNVVDVVSRIASDELVPYSDADPSLILTRVFRDCAWQDEWRLFRPPPPPAPVPAYRDSERLRRLAQSKPIGSSVWELGIIHLPTPVQERKGMRPYLPIVILAVDRETGLILGTKALGVAPSVTERQDLLVEVLETAEMAPSEIVVDTETTARLIDSITGPLGIRLSTGTMAALDEAKEDLMTFID